MKWKFKTIMRCFLFLVTFSVVGGSVLYNTNISFRKTTNNLFGIEDNFLKEENLEVLPEIQKPTVDATNNFASLLESMQEQMYLKDITIQELNAEIVSVNDTLASKLEEIETLSAEKTLIENELLDVELQLENSETAKEELIQIRDDLNNRLIATNTQLANKVNEYEIAQSTILKLEEDKAELVLEMENLEAEAVQLRLDYQVYQDFIETMRGENQIFVTFNFDNTCHNMQLVEKNSKVAVLTPENTEDARFNYWSINDEEIDLNNYVFTEDTQVVANVTKPKIITFEYNGEIVDTKKVFAGEMITGEIFTPDDDGFNFWAIDGEQVDFTSYVVTDDVVIVADVNSTCLVTFTYGSYTYSREVEKGSTASNYAVNAPVGSLYVWTLDGENAIDLETFIIVEDVNFIAIVYYTDARTNSSNLPKSGVVDGSYFGNSKIFDALVLADDPVKVTITIDYIIGYRKKTFIGSTSYGSQNGTTTLTFTIDPNIDKYVKTSQTVRTSEGLSVVLKTNQNYSFSLTNDGLDYSITYSEDKMEVKSGTTTYTIDGFSFTISKIELKNY